jgi:hypothetical protein
VKFSLTRLFIERPDAGLRHRRDHDVRGHSVDTITIVKELYPDVSQPTVTISGAVQRRLGHRDARQHRPADRAEPRRHRRSADDQLGRQQGQASITAIFDISSDSATDLALTNKAIQAAEKVPSDQPHAADGQPLRSDAVGRRDARALLAEALAVASWRSTRSTSSRRSSNKSRHFVRQRRRFGDARVRSRRGSDAPCRGELDARTTSSTPCNRTTSACPADLRTSRIVRRRSTSAATFKTSTACATWRSFVGRSAPRTANSTGPRWKVTGAASRHCRGRGSVDGNQLGRSCRRRRNRHGRLRAASAVRPHQRQTRPLPAGAEVLDRERGRRLQQRAARAPASSASSRKSKFRVINVQSKFTEQQINIVTRTLGWRSC